jgi:uncharacterized lipoprotein YddW (UPF0748 family)
MKSNITIRLGASYDTVTVDGVAFDRSKMTRQQKAYLRQKVVLARFGKGAYANA